MDERMDAPNGKRIVELLRKAAMGSYEDSKGKVMDNLAQLIGCDGEMYFHTIGKLADMVEEAIQREHESAYDEGWDAGFASADDWCAQHEDAMAEHGWVRLPKDANGEVIHLGDVVMLPDWPLNHHKVINLVYAHDGWAIISKYGSIEASEHTVHVKPKQPTVEDLLTEFARECLTYATCVDDHEVTDAIELYAAKLQLRGDE